MSVANCRVSNDDRVDASRPPMACDPAVEPDLSASPATPHHDAADGDTDPDPESLEAFVAAVKHVPLFTGTALQLLRSVDREEITAGELSRLISTDAGLASHLLRIVNSPYYGLSRRIGTVTDALAVLGFNLVRRTVTAAVLKRPLLSYLHDGPTARDFWRHGLQCAALSRHLAIRRGYDGEFAYMAGLLHDIGRLVMLAQFPGHGDVLLDRHREDDGPGLSRERSQFGFDHTQVGGALLELWGLPAGMIQAAHQHAEETEPDEPIAASVWRGNLIGHVMADEYEAGTYDPDAPPEWMDAIDLSVKSREQIANEIAALEQDQG